MRCSLNELYRTCQKAAEGVGVPAGVDIDVAESTVWLVARGLPALESLVSELEQISRKGCEGWALDVHLDATGRPSAVLARGLVDLLIAKFGDGDDDARLALKGFSSPLYLLPAARRYVHEGWRFDFDLRTSAGERVALVVGVDETKLTASQGSMPVELAQGAEFELTASCGRDKRTLAEERSDFVVLMSEESLGESESHSLANGVVVEPALWDRLQVFAVSVLVPASEESRARGAG